MLPRIVSLLPSATEIAVALGAGAQLVGRSHECDFPAWVPDLPICTSTKLEKGLSSREIEDRVQAIVTSGLSVYDVDAPLLRSLKPDVILTQSQCAICAVTPADLEEALNTWVGAEPQLISTAPDTLDDVYGDIARIGEAIQRRSEARHLIGTMKNALALLSTEVSETGRPKLFAVEWLDPLMVAGNWVPELVRAAGAKPLLADPGVHSHAIAFDAVAEADPDLIVMMPCGYRVEQTLKEARSLMQTAAWKRLQAVREGQVFAVDGHHLFNRPGPRLLQSAQLLAAIVRDPGQALRDWPRFCQRV